MKFVFSKKPKNSYKEGELSTIAKSASSDLPQSLILLSVLLKICSEMNEFHFSTDTDSTLNQLIRRDSFMFLRVWWPHKNSFKAQEAIYHDKYLLCVAYGQFNCAKRVNNSRLGWCGSCATQKNSAFMNGDPQRKNEREFRCKRVDVTILIESRGLVYAIYFQCER